VVAPVAVAPASRAGAARDERGITLVEVLVALAILFAGLIAIVETFSAGYLDVVAGGGQTTATAYARQQLEVLRSLSFQAMLDAGNGTDNPDGETTRTWTIAVVPGTASPNRQARITVTVTWRAGWRGYQSITVETIRGEWG
jgi:Tfp pilus assembly protein PilV